MPNVEEIYIVVAQTDERAAGTKFGPFGSRDQAEACVLALAARPDIKSALITKEA